jgi:hypothetical protein
MGEPLSGGRGGQGEAGGGPGRGGRPGVVRPGWGIGGQAGGGWGAHPRAPLPTPPPSPPLAGFRILLARCCICVFVVTVFTILGGLQKAMVVARCPLLLATTAVPAGFCPASFSKKNNHDNRSNSPAAATTKRRESDPRQSNTVATNSGNFLRAPQIQAARGTVGGCRHCGSRVCTPWAPCHADSSARDLAATNEGRPCLPFPGHCRGTRAGGPGLVRKLPDGRFRLFLFSRSRTP